MGLFSKKDWSVIPSEELEIVKTKLGTEEFSLLDVLARKYKLFNTPLFTESRKNGLFHMGLPIFLNSVADHILTKKGNIKDTFAFLEISIKLQDEHNAAHYKLAILHYAFGRNDEASREAQKALVIINNWQTNKTSLPETKELLSKIDGISVDQRNKGLLENKKMMESIISGTLDKFALLEDLS